jgi:hypothetical protein
MRKQGNNRHPTPDHFPDRLEPYCQQMPLNQTHQPIYTRLTRTIPILIDLLNFRLNLKDLSSPLHFCALKAHKVSPRSCKPNTKVKPNETPLQRNICCDEETKGDPVLSPNKASHKICLGLILSALFEDHYLVVSKKN